MSSLPYINLPPVSPEESLLTVIFMVIFLFFMLALLFLIVRDEIWDKQHNI